MSWKQAVAALATIGCAAEAASSVRLLNERRLAHAVPDELHMIVAVGLLFTVATLGFAWLARRRPPTTQPDRAMLEEFVRLERYSAERLAAQLHAGPVQSLIVAHHLLGDGTGDAEGAFDELAEQLREAEREVRDVMVDARPPALATSGFGAACQHLHETLDAREGLTIAWQWDTGTSRALPPVVADLAYRFLQEALSNVAKHSGCSHAQANLVVLPDELKVTVTDCGVGFCPPRLQERATSTAYRTTGLHMLSARATVLGARMSLTTAAGQGTSISLYAPLASEGDLHTIRIGDAPGTPQYAVEVL